MPPRIVIRNPPTANLRPNCEIVHAARPGNLQNTNEVNSPGSANLDSFSDVGGQSNFLPQPAPVHRALPPRKSVDDIFKECQQSFMDYIKDDDHARWSNIQPLIDNSYRDAFAHPKYGFTETELEALLDQFRETACDSISMVSLNHFSAENRHRVVGPTEAWTLIQTELTALDAWPCIHRHVKYLVEQRLGRIKAPEVPIDSLRDPKYKFPSNDSGIMEIQVHNIKRCIYDNSLFTHRELAEQLGPLCIDFRIDTTIVNRPLYQYDDAKKIWKRNVDVNQLENWIDRQIKGLIEKDIPPLVGQISNLQVSTWANRDNKNKKKEIEKEMEGLQKTLDFLKLRLKTMGGKTWASNVTACLMPILHNLSELEEVDSEGTRIPKFGARLEGNRFLFTLQDNKVLDLRKSEIRDRERKDYCTLISGVKWDPAASSEEFENFLAKLMCYAEEMVNFLAESICYTMSGDMILEVFFMCIGRPDCGKTSLFEILDLFFGEYQYEVPKSLYLFERTPRHGPDPTMLGTQHKRFGATAELGLHDVFDNTKMNALSTGQKTTVKAMYALENQSFKPSMKPWFHTNNIPKMDLDEAIVKRFIYFPMRHKFSKNPNPENKESESLIEKGYHRRFLNPEGLSGVLNYLLPHLRQFNNRNRNLPPIPQLMKDAIQEEVKARDTFQGWIDQCCDVSDPNGKIETHTALGSYNGWAMDPVRKGKVKTYNTVNAFTTAMKARGYHNEKARDNDGISVRHYWGIKLRQFSTPCDNLNNQLQNALSTQASLV